MAVLEFLTTTRVGERSHSQVQEQEKRRRRRDKAQRLDEGRMQDDVEREESGEIEGEEDDKGFETRVGERFMK